MKKTYFKVNLANVLDSKELKSANQRIILLKLLSDYKNTEGTVFSTVSSVISKSLGISTTTFRKDRDVLEQTGFFQVKVKSGSYKWVEAKSNDRKHRFLYYFLNFQLLEEMSFIKIKQKKTVIS